MWGFLCFDLSEIRCLIIKNLKMKEMRHKVQIIDDLYSKILFTEELRLLKQKVKYQTSSIWEIVVVLLQYRHYSLLRQKSNRLEFYKNYIVFTDFISILILRKNYSIFFFVNDFILIIIFFSYYRRFFYSGKNTPHYRYMFGKITP